MLVSAAINRMITKKKSDTNTSNRYEAIMDQVVDRSYDIYRDLVFEMNISMTISLNQVQSRLFPASISVRVQQLVRPSLKLAVCVPFLGSSHGHKAVSCSLDGTELDQALKSL